MHARGTYDANASLQFRGSRMVRFTLRALRLRCPHCGRGKVWRTPFHMKERCPHCGIHTARGEHDYFLGAILVNLVAAELLLAGLLVILLIATWPDPPWGFLEYGGVALMVAAPFALYPFTKTMWLAVDLAVRPASPEEFTPAAGRGVQGS